MRDKNNPITLLDEREKKLEAELEQLRKDKEAATNTTPEVLAVFLHEKYCRHNHTDGCGWHYETSTKADVVTHNWNGDSHKRWLATTKGLLEFEAKHGIGRSELLDFINTIRYM